MTQSSVTRLRMWLILNGLVLALFVVSMLFTVLLVRDLGADTRVSLCSFKGDLARRYANSLAALLAEPRLTGLERNVVQRRADAQGAALDSLSSLDCPKGVTP